MQLHDVAILGFRLNAPEPPEKALVRVFRIEPQVARTMLRSFPLVVKHGVSLTEARTFEAALVAIGARVEVRVHAPVPAQAAPVAQPAPPMQPAPAPQPFARAAPAVQHPAALAVSVPGRADRPMALSPLEATRDTSPARGSHATVLQRAPLGPKSTPEPPRATQPTMLQSDFDPRMLAQQQPSAGMPARQARFETTHEVAALAPPTSAPSASAFAADTGTLRAANELLGLPAADEPLFSPHELHRVLDASGPASSTPDTAFGGPLAFDEASFTFEPPLSVPPQVPANANAPSTPPSSVEGPRGAKVELADDGLPLELAIPVARTQDISAALAAIPRELLVPPRRETSPREPAGGAETPGPASAKEPPSPAHKAPVFGDNLALPWLDAEVQRAASVRPPPGNAPSQRPLPARRENQDVPRKAESPRARAEAPAAAQSTLPFAPSVPGPLPIPPSRELSADVLSELSPNAERLLRTVGLVGLVVLLGFVCLAMGASLLGVLLLLSAGLVGLGSRAYESVCSDLEGVLEPLSGRTATQAEIYLRGYDRWARYHGFAPLGLYARRGTSELVGVFGHGELSAYFFVRLTPRGTLWELCSLFEREHALITTSASYVLPPVPGLFRQSYTREPLERLMTLHAEGHEFLRLHAKLAPLGSLPPFQTTFASLQSARARALSAIPLWPLWLLAWRVILPHQLGDTPVTRG